MIGNGENSACPFLIFFSVAIFLKNEFVTRLINSFDNSCFRESMYWSKRTDIKMP